MTSLFASQIADKGQSLWLVAALVFTTVAAEPLRSQAPAPQGPAAAPAAPIAIKGKLERIKVHGKSLEGNLMGESAEPEVSIYLPPSYAKDRSGVIRWSICCTATPEPTWATSATTVGRVTASHRRARVCVPAPPAR